ncbi:maestro heat-like repeat family member 5 [Sceloporus undulatus]|uniref:maestro heat-like repeat family member 5 n=1 Tax=Sceloporus undulatus TaxID=8520 RepID=UPI001C4D19DC|nr:maestro heat-like repeat family member 5 [Sceloporus undulatus]
MAEGGWAGSGPFLGSPPTLGFYDSKFFPTQKGHFISHFCSRICSTFKKEKPWRRNRIQVQPGGADPPCPDVQETFLHESELEMCLSDLEKEQMKEAEAKLLHLATTDVSRVLLSIWRFRQSRHKISPQHRLKMNEVLQAVIASAGSINIEAADLTIKMAAEDALSITDLRDVYQDAAGNILVALWDHFPAEVLTRLLESFQNRLLPYHSILHILGKLANKAFAESNVAKINIWEQKLEEYVYRLLTNVSEKIYLEEVSREIMKEEPERKSWDLEKLFLYQYYGFILRATDDSHLVQEHLRSILALSRRGPLEAKGIASALGLAASRHLKEVLDSLDRFLANASMQEKGLAHGSQGPPWDTLLLCFGRVALDIKAEVLPRANMIASQMAMLCTANPQDMDLKKTFLVAVLMLLEAIEATGKAKHLRLTMKTQLVECLTMVIEGEPTQKLANTVRQDAMHIVAQLSKLKPPLEQSRKSRLLCAAFQSVFALPPLDTLEDISAKALFCQTMGTLEGMLQGLITEDPYSCDLAHMMETMEPWVTSSSIHIRERAVGMATALMKYVASHLNLHHFAIFSMK